MATNAPALSELLSHAKRQASNIVGAIACLIDAVHFSDFRKLRAAILSKS